MKEQEELDKCKRVLSFLFKKMSDKPFEEMMTMCSDWESINEKIKEQEDIILLQKKRVRKAEIIINEQKSLLKNQDELLRLQNQKKMDLIRILEKVRNETHEEKTKQYISLKLNLL